jgi:hypothetical protein
MHSTFARLAMTALGTAGLSLGLAAAPAGASPAATRAATAAAASTFQIYNDKAQECIGIDSGAAGAWVCSGGADQTWHWGSVSRDGFHELINGDRQCLGVANSSGAEGAQIRAVSCAQTTNDPDDVFWATSASPAAGWDYIWNFNSLLVIGILGGSNANGAELVQWQQLSHPDQYWFLPSTP